MQESEQDDNGAWESHWEKVGAKAGARKACGSYELRFERTGVIIPWNWKRGAEMIRENPRRDG